MPPPLIGDTPHMLFFKPVGYLLGRRPTLQEMLMNISNSLLQSLRSCLDMNQSTFRKYVNDVTKTKHGDMMFQDNGADVLAVAHLDTVIHNPKYKVDKSDPANVVISKCPQLDDRLGAWVILHLIPHMFPHLNYDILLTDSEEIGESTAQYFETTKQYNWMFEFDRNGVDSVTYGYSSPAWDAEVSKISQVGRGSFSDISYLDHLGCRGMNVGVGYYGQHTNDCFANICETVYMAMKFGDWATENMDNAFPFEYPTLPKFGSSLGWPDSDYRNYPISTPVFEQVCQICHASTDQDVICYGCQKNALDSYHSDRAIDQQFYNDAWRN